MLKPREGVVFSNASFNVHKQSSVSTFQFTILPSFVFLNIDFPACVFFPRSAQSLRKRNTEKQRERIVPFRAPFVDHSEENQKEATLLLASRTQHPANTIPNNINQTASEKRKKIMGWSWEILTFSSEKMKLSWKITGMSSFVTYKIHIHVFYFPVQGTRLTTLLLFLETLKTKITKAKTQKRTQQPQAKISSSVPWNATKFYNYETIIKKTKTEGWSYYKFFKEIFG